MKNDYPDKLQGSNVIYIVEPTTSLPAILIAFSSA